MFAKILNKKFGLKHLLILVVLLPCLSMGAVQNGCITTTQSRTVAGAGLGAALGAGIGALTGNAGLGAAIGAGAGAIGGAFWPVKTVELENDDIEKAKLLSGEYMTRKKLNDKLVNAEFSVAGKNAIVNQARAIEDINSRALFGFTAAGGFEYIIPPDKSDKS